MLLVVLVCVVFGRFCGRCVVVCFLFFWFVCCVLGCVVVGGWFVGSC